MTSTEAPKPPEFTNPGMTADLVCRVVLAVLANIACWVPLRLLWKNGEFAASVFCGNVILFNAIYAINALIWRDNDISKWFDGTGWCDLQNYIAFPMTTLYSACVFAIMRHLAMQLSFTRATGLTREEKRRRSLLQALIVFPMPLIQVAMTYPLIQFRYAITTLHGCRALYSSNPLFLTFFILPAPVFVVGALFYAGLTYKRFRDLSKTTRAVHATNSSAVSRNSRARRKLYLMALGVLLPFAPVQMGFLVLNILGNMPWDQPYDFYAIHNPPERWNFIPKLTTDKVGFIDLHVNYIPILTVIPIFIYFGTSKEALNTWRRYFLAMGLGKIFKGLNREYDPDRMTVSQHNPNSLQSWGTSTVASGERKASFARDNGLPNLPQFQTELQEINQNGSPGTNSSNNPTPTVMMGVTVVQTHSQLPILPSRDDDDEVRISPRNPFLFRTVVSTPLKLPPFPKLGSFRRGRNIGSSAAAAAAQSPDSGDNTTTASVSDRYQLKASPTERSASPATRGKGRGRRGGRRDNNHDEEKGEAAAAVAAGGGGGGAWNPSPTGSLVETRVWSDDRPAAAADGSSSSREPQGPGQDGEGDGKGKGKGGRAASPHLVHVRTHIATSSSKR